jgi:site-specific DNA recombinase
MPYKRQAMDELFEEAKQKSFEKVIVAKLDRLARDLYVQLWTEKELKVYDIEVLSVAEPYRGNDPMAVTMRQIVGVFAEPEKRRITERLVSGRLKKFSQGGYAEGNPSLGYESVEGELKVNQEEAETVRMIKKLRKQGLSMQRIAQRLNNAKINTKRGGR